MFIIKRKIAVNKYNNAYKYYYNKILTETFKYKI